MSVARIAGSLLLGLSLVLVAGCQRPEGSVSGKVTYKSVPLKGGNVTFISTEGQPSNSAAINEDGTYKVPVLKGGNYKVVVETASLKPPKTGMNNKGIPSKPLDKDTPVPEGYTPSSPADAALAKNAKRYMPIDEKYSDQEKSGLAYTVVAGEQTFDIDLK